MSKPPKTDFKALIAGQLGPAVSPEPELPPEPEPPPAAPEPSIHREVVTLKPRRAPQAPAPVAEGTLKQRAHQLSLYLEAPVYDRLRDIAFHERTKLHPLLLEAIDLLLKKRGAPSIKELIKEAREKDTVL
jgi:hypothetical protein